MSREPQCTATGFYCAGSTRRRACLQRVVVADVGGSACVVAELGLVRQRLQVGEQDLALLHIVGAPRKELNLGAESAELDDADGAQGAVLSLAAGLEHGCRRCRCRRGLVALCLRTGVLSVARVREHLCLGVRAGRGRAGVGGAALRFIAKAEPSAAAQNIRGIRGSLGTSLAIARYGCRGAETVRGRRRGSRGTSAHAARGA